MSDNHKSGIGILTFADGLRVESEFETGALKGTIKFIRKDGSVIMTTM